MAEGKAQETRSGGQGGQESAVTEDELNLVSDDLEEKSDEEVWNELAAEESAKSGAGNGKDPDESAEAIVSTDDDESGQAAAAAAAASGDDDSGEGKGKQAGDDAESAGDGKAGSDAGAEGDDDDGAGSAIDWSNASDEQRAAFDAAQADLKKLRDDEAAHKGRLRSVQRQLNDLQREVEKSRRQGSQMGGDAAGRKASDDADDLLASDDWKGLEKEYPEITGPLGKVVRNLQKRLVDQGKQQAEFQTSVVQTQHASNVEEQQALLEDEHPDWVKVAADERFDPWLEKQPRMIREGYDRNSKEIVDAAEAAFIIGSFKMAFRSGSGRDAGQRPQSDSQQGSAGAGNGSALSGKRKRQLASSAGIRSKGPGVAQGIPEEGDPQDLWNAWDRYDKQKAAAAGA